MSLREGSKVVSNSTAKEVELGEGWGRPMERAGKWVEEAMRKARPLPEGQEGEDREGEAGGEGGGGVDLEVKKTEDQKGNYWRYRRRFEGAERSPLDPTRLNQKLV
ncbi:hypothetical protein DEO72_LG4g2815 [Vigna unguiculata]|uniref:Uncharacterized protein n=1 Tax=Vigna unguiculata TaxID=3917 RepID=A0A4D6LTH7_VIGUN|nr:hypothetical protein DEO72_LG4g2815 [Vigna unguiculata]